MQTAPWQRYLAVMLATVTVWGTLASRGAEGIEPPPLPDELVSSPSIPPVPYQSPFAVAGDKRQALPPLDCLRCPGPVPFAPCDRHHHGFLYYRRPPWSLHDPTVLPRAASGQTGHAAAGLSRLWIHLREFRGAAAPPAGHGGPAAAARCR